MNLMFLPADPVFCAALLRQWRPLGARVRDVQGAMIGAVLLAGINNVTAFRRLVVAFELFGTFRLAAQSIPPPPPPPPPDDLISLDGVLLCETASSGACAFFSTSIRVAMLLAGRGGIGILVIGGAVVSSNATWSGAVLAEGGVSGALGDSGAVVSTGA